MAETTKRIYSAAEGDNRVEPSPESSPQGPSSQSGREAKDTLRFGSETPLAMPRAEMLDMRRCHECGTYYSGDELFCPFDGTALVSAPEWDPSTDPLIGKTLTGRYRIEKVLAEGGMGTVYQVRHTKLGNAFAMKVLRRDLAEDPEVALRLIEEARATAAIGHPNIASVTDFGEIDATVLPNLADTKLPYFVMELVSGNSLADAIVEHGPMPAERVANIAVQVANALSAAHGVNIVHRDLKPENIRLTRDDAGMEIAKVLDFGVAKVIGSSKMTQVGMVFGTPHYMSPEQGQGQPVDHHTDIYSLGVIMYECLSGSVPFSADSFMGVIRLHLFERPAPLMVSSDVPIEAIMLRCLEKRPAQRFGSMAELVDALETALEGRARKARRSARPLYHAGDAATPASSRLTRADEGRARLLWWALAAIIFGGGGFMAVLWALGSSEQVAAPATSDVAATESAPITAEPTVAVGATAPSPAVSASGDDPASATATVVAGPPSTTAKASAAPTSKPSKPPPARTNAPAKQGDVVDPWGK